MPWRRLPAGGKNFDLVVGLTTLVFVIHRAFNRKVSPIIVRAAECFEVSELSLSRKGDQLLAGG
jgi:hypothetical protein